MRDAAGDRFDAIELNALIQFVVHTDDREASAAELAATFGGVSPQFVLDSPFVLLGTHEQMAETLARAPAAVRGELLDRVRRVGRAARRPCPISRKSLRCFVASDFGVIWRSARKSRRNRELGRG